MIQSRIGERLESHYYGALNILDRSEPSANASVSTRWLRSVMAVLGKGATQIEERDDEIKALRRAVSCPACACAMNGGPPCARHGTSP